MKTDSWKQAIAIGEPRYVAAMQQHSEDMARGYCRKCKREFGTSAKLRMHYQSDGHRKKVVKKLT